VAVEMLLHRHMGEGTRLHNDMEALRELLATYEQSIQRKDQVISNLTAGLQHHRNRMEVQQSFAEWKMKHNDVKREVFLAWFTYLQATAGDLECQKGAVNCVSQSLATGTYE